MYLREGDERKAIFDTEMEALKAKLDTEAVAIQSFRDLQLEMKNERITYEDEITGEILVQTNIREQAQIESLNRIILKLKEAISLQSSLGGGSKTKGFAAGGLVGFAKGGFTKGGAAQVAGVVHGGEYVAPKWQVNALKPVFNALDSIRRGGNVSTTNNYTINNQSTGSAWNDLLHIKFATKYA
jgi:hypothetical protein